MKKIVSTIVASSLIVSTLSTGQFASAMDDMLDYGDDEIAENYFNKIYFDKEDEKVEETKKSEKNTIKKVDKNINKKEQNIEDKLSYNQLLEIQQDNQNQGQPLLLQIKKLPENEEINKVIEKDIAFQNELEKLKINQNEKLKYFGKKLYEINDQNLLCSEEGTEFFNQINDEICQLNTVINNNLKELHSLDPIEKIKLLYKTKVYSVTLSNVTCIFHEAIRMRKKTSNDYDKQINDIEDLSKDLKRKVKRLNENNSIAKYLVDLGFSLDNKINNAINFCNESINSIADLLINFLFKGTKNVSTYLLLIIAGSIVGFNVIKRIK